MALEQNTHLRNFYIIVPPLCVNFMEHIMSARDRLSRGKHGKDVRRCAVAQPATPTCLRLRLRTAAQRLAHACHRSVLRARPVPVRRCADLTGSAD
jgi:hypothetical protein